MRRAHGRTGQSVVRKINIVIEISSLFHRRVASRGACAWMTRDPEKSRLVLRGFPRKRRMTPTTPPTTRVKTRAVNEWMKEFTCTRILPRIVARARVSSRHRRVGSTSWTPSQSFRASAPSLRPQVAIVPRSRRRTYPLGVAQTSLGSERSTHWSSRRIGSDVSSRVCPW